MMRRVTLASQNSGSRDKHGSNRAGKDLASETNAGDQNLQTAIDNLNRYEEAEYDYKVKMVGASPFCQVPIYQQKKMHFGRTTEDGEVMNKLKKNKITEEGKVFDVLKEWQDRKPLSVWMSRSLPVDMNLPITSPCPLPDTLQALLLCVGCPALVLSLYKSQQSAGLADNRALVHRFTVQTARMMTKHLHDFCSCDFVLLPCTLERDSFCLENLQKEVVEQVKGVRIWFQGRIELNVSFYASMRAAADTIASVSYVPCIVPDVKSGRPSKEPWLLRMDDHWRDVLSLVIETFEQGCLNLELTFTEESEYKSKVVLLEAARRLAFREQVVLIARDERIFAKIRALTTYTGKEHRPEMKLCIVEKDTPNAHTDAVRICINSLDPALTPGSRGDGHQTLRQGEEPTNQVMRQEKPANQVMRQEEPANQAVRQEEPVNPQPALPEGYDRFSTDSSKSRHTYLEIPDVQEHSPLVKRQMAGEASRTTDVQDTRCQARACHVAVCVGETLIVWGGVQVSADKDYDELLPSSDVWLYNADMDFWTCRKCAGQHPPPTDGASSVLVRPYWYIIGGWTLKGFTDHVYRLHVTTLEWERVKTSSPGLSPRFSFSTWAHNDTIYCFGGFGPDIKSKGLHQHSDFVEEKKSSLKEGWNLQSLVLDVNTQQWSNPSCKGIAPSPRFGHAAALLGDEVYICGGVYSDGMLIDLYRLNLATKTWSGELTTKGPLPERRCYHSLTAVGRDRLLLFGGLAADGNPLEDLWLLSTATMEWTLVKELTGHPLCFHTACCTQSGNVLVFGGYEDYDRSRKRISRCSDQILEIQIKPLERPPSKYEAILDISGELRDIAGALHDLPRLPSLHDIQMSEKWSDLSNHDPKHVDVVTVGKHDTAMRQHFDTASSGKYRTVYRMQQKTRGLFLLINNESFQQACREKGYRISDRAGTAVDAAALCELFTQLGFEIYRKDNCTAKDMRRELRDMLSRDHSEYDCFACAILSHGELGAILGTDGEPFSLYGTNSSSREVMADSLMDIVTKSGCKSLAGKPKLFFIQACQGESADTGIDRDDTTVTTADVTDDNVTDEEKESDEMKQGEEKMDVTRETRIALEDLMEGLEVADSRRVPSGADLFIAEATTPGFMSHRNTLHGTWFMQALVYVFSKFAHMLDISELMTAVNYLVSISETRRGGFKQQSSSRSTLNKKLYFFPGLYKPR